MDLTEVRTAQDLERLGSVDEIRQQLGEIVRPLKVDGSSYAELFAVVQTLQEKWLDLREGPFVSRQAELVFYLTKLDGSVRNEFLGITDAHYHDPKVAKRWFRSMSQLVHSDRGGDDGAFQTLQDLYDVMTAREEDDAS